MNVKAVERETKRWYILYRGTIPTVGTREYAKFAGRSFSLVVNLAGEASSGYTVSVEKSPTAYINQSKKQIVVPAWYLDGDAIKAVNDSITDVSASAVTLLNGSVVHETFHLLHTPSTLTTLLEAGGPTKPLYEKYGQAANDAANILEDLYIESLASYCQYAQFVTGKNVIIFSEENFKKVSEEWKAEPKSLLKALQLAVFYKNEFFRADKVWEKLPFNALQALKLLSSAAAKLTTETRAVWIIKFLNSFEIKSDEVQPVSGSDNVDGSGSTESEASKLAEEAESSKSESKEKKSSKSDFETAATEAIEEGSSMMKLSEYGDIFHKIVLEDIDSCNQTWHSRRVEVPTNFSFLNTILRLRTKNHAPGEAKVRGSKIVNTRVYRISTDGKMFSNQNSQQDKMERIEVIILVDASGSTRFCHDGSRSGDLLAIETSNAEAIHKALRKVGIANSVYAHTSIEGSESRGFNQPVLYHVSSYDMKSTTSNYEDKFTKLLNIQASENYDGYAIELAAKKFTSRPSKKLLIVLSDGEPSGPGYMGGLASKHTKEVVAKLRKTGIGVVCMSLVSSVIRKNNEIYGANNNIDATKNIQKEFERIITNLQQEI